MKRSITLLMAVITCRCFVSCADAGEKYYVGDEKQKLPVYSDNFEVKADVREYDIENLLPQEPNEYNDTLILDKWGHIYLDIYKKDGECTGYTLDVDTAPGVLVFYNKSGQIEVSVERGEDHKWTKLNIHDAEGYITHSKEITGFTGARQWDYDRDGSLKLLKLQIKDYNWVTVIDNYKIV